MIYRRDTAIVGALLVTLTILAGLVALPTPAPPEVVEPGATLPPAPGPTVYREGVVGGPYSITPLTARTRADRVLVGLIFSGLVRVGKGGSLEPDLAASWSADETGKTWTFHIRPDARWHDGEPVTADDVVFTANALKSPDVAGPAAASWAEVTASVVDPLTVSFTLETPLGGFLAAATQPLLPAHLLADVPLADLADDVFGIEPIGTGPYRLITLLEDRAILEPATEPEPEPSPTPRPVPTDSLATPMPTLDPGAVAPGFDAIEIHFFADSESLNRAFRAGELHAASGLPPATAGPLATATKASLLRYPTTTLSAILLDLRPGDPELRDARVRRALLGALDRDALITGPLGGAGLRADALVPPGSWAFDPASAKRVPFDLKAARVLLTEAGWKQVDGKWRAPRASTPYAIEVLAPSASSNAPINAIAASVVEAWTALGIDARLVAADPAALAMRLRQARFTAAVVDIAYPLDPDLYPMLASSQATTRGGNLSGIQDRRLDPLLEAARKPGTLAARQAAWRKLLEYLATSQPILPLAWRDETVVIKGVNGPLPRLIGRPGDRFSDVLTWRLASDG
jgi:peptide/nickel transport system substrate-binding protein